MKWMIVSDSSCEIRTLEGTVPGVQFAIVPFKIIIDGREYVDLPALDVPDMIRAMTAYKGVSTSACPSPEEWAAYYREADCVIALTISSNLSGSYNSAMAARDMVLEESPEKKIFVLDTLSDSGALADAAVLANRMIGEGASFERICEAITAYNDAGHIMFALSSFENLAKNGRVNRVVGFIADRLHMRVLGRRTPDGRTRSVMISHCMNPEGAGRLRDSICARWSNARVSVVHCAGLCSFYAQEKGIIITY